MIPNKEWEDVEPSFGVSEGKVSIHIHDEAETVILLTPDNARAFAKQILETAKHAKRWKP